MYLKINIICLNIYYKIHVLCRPSYDTLIDSLGTLKKFKLARYSNFNNSQIQIPALPISLYKSAVLLFFKPGK